MKSSVGRAFSSETTPSFVSFTRSSLARVEGSKQWKAAYDGILGWKPGGGEQAVERRGPGGIRHTGRFLLPRLSRHNFHNLKHCLSTPQILIRPERNWFDTSGCNQRRYWRVLSIALNIIHQLCGGSAADEGWLGARGEIRQLSDVVLGARLPRYSKQILACLPPYRTPPPPPPGRLPTRDGMTSSSSQNLGYFHIWNKSFTRFRSVPALPDQLSPKSWLALSWSAGNSRAALSSSSEKFTTI